MRTAVLVTGAAVGAMLCAGGTTAAELPQLRRNGQAVQLMVDGAPYLALGGEAHNSSPSSPSYPVQPELHGADLGAPGPQPACCAGRPDSPLLTPRKRRVKRRH